MFWFVIFYYKYYKIFIFVLVENLKVFYQFKRYWIVDMRDYLIEVLVCYKIEVF